MKLLYCPECLDIISLTASTRTCRCGKSAGSYVGHNKAEYCGKAVPIGFSTREFLYALDNRPDSSPGKVFTAFVIPKVCPTVEMRREQR